MVKESLYIKVMQDGEEVNFPINGDEPVRLNTATYTAQRMGSAPTITADFYYPRILDNDWTHKEYVTFRGEKYYVDMTPSAEKDNSTLLYKHSITLVSERIKLEHEFFYDVVSEDTEVQYSDRYRSNISKFSFYGDIEEFAARLTDSLIYTGFCTVTTDADGNKVYDGYHVVVTEGITSDIVEVSFENKRIAEALQLINSSFELAYYFVGKEIRVGYTENLIEHVFDYGMQDGLLKIQHTNSNDAIVDRITGTGSSDNLPYYYPNESADGQALYKVENSGIEGDDVVKSASMSTLYRNVTYPVGKTLRLHYREACPTVHFSFAPTTISVPFVDLNTCTSVTDGECEGAYLHSYNYSRSYNPAGPTSIVAAITEGYPLMYYFMMYGYKTTAEIGMEIQAPTTFSAENFAFMDTARSEEVSAILKPTSITWGIARKTKGTRSGSGETYQSVLETMYSADHTYDFVDEDGDYWSVIEEITGESYYEFTESFEFRLVVILRFFTATGQLSSSGGCAVKPAINTTPSYFHNYSYDSGYWFEYKADGVSKTVTYEKSGITFKDISVINKLEHEVVYDRDTGFVVKDADESLPTTEVTITARRWIAPTSSLMPSLYRNSLGAERYFNAHNGEDGYEKTFEWDDDGSSHTFDYGYAYTIGQSSDHYTFLNLYEEGNPHADNQEFEEIKPTVKDVRNDVILRKTTDGDFSDSDSKTYVVGDDGKYIYENYDDDGNPAGQLYGEIAAVAFDDNDSDVLKNTSDSDTKEYVHSYFYIKLHKFSGDMAFNLFDQASESDTAKIEMTSGNCAGCSFEIGVPEPKEVEDGKYKFYNPVQVKDNGDIADGDYTNTTIAAGDFGEKVKVGYYQDVQQDTSTNEVWIALKKENSTYGVVMPNAAQNYRPQAGDTFVITGINAPLSYITAAEKRLDKALVDYMADNNTEKWNFSITFSRIWLTEHPDVANQLNENARIYVRYNGVNTLLYVTSYSVKMDSDILEEITVELADEIDDLSQGTLTAKLNEMKSDIVSTVRNSDFSTYVTTAKKYFLNRRSDASEDERTMRGKAILAAGVDATEATVTGDISVGGDAVVAGGAAVSGVAVVGGNTILNGDLSISGDATHAGATQFGPTFLDALIGTGGRIDAQGNGVLRSLRLWESLSVPRLDYNEVHVNTGIDWGTFGGGTVESVTVDTDADGNALNSGVITLKLEDGAIGAVEVDDLCMGIFHNVSGGNATEDSDTHDGNFHFAGFSTVYFRVDEILDAEYHSQFRYTLRTSSDWPARNHPQAQMDFACYANPTDTSRQNCRYSTTRYQIALHDMTTWTYSGSNLYLIIGELDGFTMNGKTFSGTGIVMGNAYIYGNIEQWYNAVASMTIASDVGDTLAPGESTTLVPTVMRGGQDITADVASWAVSIETGDAEADADWDAAHGNPSDGCTTITYAQLSTTSLKTMVTITAFDEDGTQLASAVKVLGKYKDGTSSISLDITPTSGLTFRNGEGTKTLTAAVTRGNYDITADLDADSFVWSRVVDGIADTSWSATGTAITVAAADVGSIPDEYSCEYTGEIPDETTSEGEEGGTPSTTVTYSNGKTLTQAEYDALTTKETIMYYIVDGSRLTAMYFRTQLIAKASDKQKGFPYTFPLSF